MSSTATASTAARTRTLSGRADTAVAATASSGPLSQGREFVWTTADFARVQGLIYQRAGISLHDGKHAMVYSRLSRRLRETGHTSFKATLNKPSKISAQTWMTQFFGLLCLSRGPFGQFAGR